MYGLNCYICKCYLIFYKFLYLKNLYFVCFFSCNLLSNKNGNVICNFVWKLFVIDGKNLIMVGFFFLLGLLVVVYWIVLIVIGEFKEFCKWLICIYM